MTVDVSPPAWLLCRLDATGGVLAVEGQVDEMLGVHAEEALGRPVAELARPGTVAAALAGWPALLDRPRGSRREHLPVGDRTVGATTVHRPVAGGVEVLFVVDPAEPTSARLGRGAGRAPAGAARVELGDLVDALSGALVDDREATLVVVVNLDRFSEVNERFGLGAGNAVLDAVGERLRSVLRPADLVGRSEGDEFVVVCRDVGDGGAPAVSGRVGEVLATPLALPGGSWVPAASVGAVRPAEGETAEAVIDRARLAMAVAKRERHVP